MNNRKFVNADGKVVANKESGRNTIHTSADLLREPYVQIDFAEAYFNRGITKHALRDYDGALADYSKSIRLEPAHAKPYCFRGRMKSDLKDYHGGIDDFTKALELNPDYAEVYFDRAIAFLGVGQKKEALADFQMAKYSGIQISHEILERCK
jgi:tetratricopeptide (TPR) repeat protein